MILGESQRWNPRLITRTIEAMMIKIDAETPNFDSSCSWVPYLINIEYVNVMFVLWRNWLLALNQSRFTVGKISSTVTGENSIP